MVPFGGTMIFDLFDLTDYTFLQLESKTGGNQIVEEWDTNGVVKLRDGLAQSDGTEAYESTSSVHIRPDEPFLTTLNGNLVGHGVRVAKDDHTTSEYRIVGQSEGRDFNTGNLDFVRVTLKRESVWDTSDLPLE